MRQVHPVSTIKIQDHIFSALDRQLQNRIKKMRKKERAYIMLLSMYPAALEGYLLRQNYPHCRALEVLTPNNLNTEQLLSMYAGNGRASLTKSSDIN